MRSLFTEKQKKKLFFKDENTKDLSECCFEVWQCGTRRPSKLRCKKVYDRATKKKIDILDYIKIKNVVHQRILPGW